MSKFRASNGVTVMRNPDDGPDIDYQSWSIGNAREVLLAPHEVDALREFFQHERDQELGRWRWPENPNWVAYSTEGGDTVTVLDETYPDEGGFTYRMGSHFLDYPHAAPAAKAYFDVHPESKPWHDAKPGEVWAITTENVSDEVAVHVTPESMWQYNDGVLFDRYELRIVTARRIWPEDSNDS